MYIVGLTGGIGSGKSTIAEIFLQKGIPTYDCDFHAKKLMNQDLNLIDKIKRIFGPETYKEEVLNKKYLSRKIFSSVENLKKINDLISPYISEDFKKWMKYQFAFYIIKESAILFESNFYADCKLIINVITPIEKRIERLLKKNFLSKEEILNRIKNQTSDKEKSEKSQFLILNAEGFDKLKEAVEKTHNKIMNKLSG